MACNVFGLIGYDSKQLIETVYDLCKGIKDPEKPETLEDLGVINEEDIDVRQLSSKLIEIQVAFTPSKSNCSLASVIGLCINIKLRECLPKQCKINVKVKKGSHVTDDEITKQIQDKERVAAAMENPYLSGLVRKLLEEF